MEENPIKINECIERYLNESFTKDTTDDSSTAVPADSADRLNH